MVSTITEFDIPNLVIDDWRAERIGEDCGTQWGGASVIVGIKPANIIWPIVPSGQVSDNPTFQPLMYAGRGRRAELMEPIRERAAPTFQELAEFIRAWGGIPKRKLIAPETLFEDDLGITGDDGCELLEATEKHFAVCLSSSEDGYRRTFDLASHEFLFHNEGLGDLLYGLVSLFDPSAQPSSIRAFRVGDLFEAIKKAPSRPVNRFSILGLED
jgi:hypothetical protein